MTQIVGKLYAKGKNWTVENVEFTVDARQNQWVVKNLKKFADDGRNVICRINKDRVLLSVKAI